MNYYSLGKIIFWGGQKEATILKVVQILQLFYRDDNTVEYIEINHSAMW